MVGLKKRTVAGGTSSSNVSSPATSSSNNKKHAKSRKQGKSGTASTTTTTTTNNNNDDNNNNINIDETDELSSWQVFVRHPLFWGLLLLGVPYLLHLFLRYVLLQKPHWIPSIFIPLLQSSSSSSSMIVRPPVSMSSPRQVLIVGSMSSGTSQVATEISNTLPNFELGHEDSDTLWKFVRDGTVSWFHGIRFFPPIHNTNGTTTNNNTNTTNSHTIPKLCKVAFSFYTSSSNYGFGPTLFGAPNYTCSPIHPQFKRCWYKECIRLVTQEYGCAYNNNNNNNNSSSSCPTPYQSNLIQTRDPWNITTSLVMKYCRNPQNITQSQKPPGSLVKLLSVLLGSMFLNQEEEEIYGTSLPYETCEALMVNYVVTYYNILLDAYHDYNHHHHHQENNEYSSSPETTTSSSSSQQKNRKRIIDGIYPIESSTVCDVGKLAGLDDLSTTVYPPHYDTFQRICHGSESGESESDTNELLQLPGVFGKTTNVINKDRLTYKELIQSMKDNSGKNNPAIFEMVDTKMRRLYSRLEYYEYPTI